MNLHTNGMQSGRSAGDKSFPYTLLPIVDQILYYSNLVINIDVILTAADLHAYDCIVIVEGWVFEVI